MSNGPGGAPKFPGDLSDHLPKREETPDRWSDRFRHAWFIYALLAVAIPLWIGSMVLVVVYMWPVGWFFALMILIIPLAVYARMLQFRLITGRDIDTGELLDRKDR